MQAMNDFVQAVRDDKEVASGLIEAVGSKEGAEAAAAFAAYARDRGFAISQESVEEAFRLVERRAGEISDEELEAVSGGSVFDIAAGVAGFNCAMFLGAMKAGDNLFSGKNVGDGFKEGADIILASR